MPLLKTAALSVVMVLAAGSLAFADVQLSFRDGRVTIIARDATVGQILAEWARIGGTKMVNVERIPRAPLTIQLENVPESQALDVVLRTASGYIAASREVVVPNISRFDRIIVLATSSVIPSSPPPLAVVRASTPSEFQPTLSPAPPAYVPPPAADDTANANDEPPPAPVGLAMQGQESRGSVSNTARQALETVDPRKIRLESQPQAGAVASPGGVGLPGKGMAVPGMIAPKPR
jgi:hypothetical protein